MLAVLVLPDIGHAQGLKLWYEQPANAAVADTRPRIKTTRSG